MNPGNVRVGREVLLCDITEKANRIIRHARTEKPCHLITRYPAAGGALLHLGLEEDSSALRESRLFRVVTTLVAPYEDP